MLRATSSYWPFQIDDMERCVYWSDYFTSGECEMIKLHCLSKGLTSGSTVSGDTDNYRKCGVYFISPLEMSWLFEKMQTAVVDLNSKYFKFDLTGFAENFQFTEYRPPSDHYNLHADTIQYGITRKITAIVQLTDETQYEGGDVLVHSGNSIEPLTLSKKQGTIQLFPSFMPHEVTSVTKGTRHSLVAWVTGPKFR